MAIAKKMNESEFARLIKEFNAVGELIRARQEEKQSIINAFDIEKKRYSQGKISKKTLESSVKKTNKEFLRLDKQIRECISKVNSLGNRSKQLASRQAPKVFRAKTQGISMLVKKKKKTVKRKTAKKVVKKKAVKKKTIKRKVVKKKSVKRRK